MTVVRDTLWKDPFFSSSPNFDDFRKEMLRESEDLKMHVKEQFKIFELEDGAEEENKTIVQKTEIREGYKLEKDKNTETLAINGPTATSTKSQDLGVLPLTYESGNEIAKMGSNDVASKLEDNQVIKVISLSYLGYSCFNIQLKYLDPS